MCWSTLGHAVVDATMVARAENITDAYERALTRTPS